MRSIFKAALLSSLLGLRLAEATAAPAPDVHIEERAPVNTVTVTKAGVTTTATATVTHTVTKTTGPTQTLTKPVTKTLTSDITSTVTKPVTKTVTSDVTEILTSDLIRTVTKPLTTTLTSDITHTVTSDIIHTTTSPVTLTITDDVTKVRTVTSDVTKTLTQKTTATQTSKTTRTVTDKTTRTVTDKTTRTQTSKTTKTVTSKTTSTQTSRITTTKTVDLFSTETDYRTRTATVTVTTTSVPPAETSTVTETLPPVTTTETDTLPPVTTTETDTLPASTVTTTVHDICTPTPGLSSTITRTVTTTVGSMCTPTPGVGSTVTKTITTGGVCTPTIPGHSRTKTKTKTRKTRTPTNGPSTANNPTTATTPRPVTSGTPTPTPNPSPASPLKNGQLQGGSGEGTFFNLVTLPSPWQVSFTSHWRYLDCTSQSQYDITLCPRDVWGYNAMWYVACGATNGDLSQIMYGLEVGTEYTVWMEYYVDYAPTEITLQIELDANAIGSAPISNNNQGIQTLSTTFVASARVQELQIFLNSFNDQPSQCPSIMIMQVAVNKATSQPTTAAATTTSPPTTTTAPTPTPTAQNLIQNPNFSGSLYAYPEGGTGMTNIPDWYGDVEDFYVIDCSDPSNHYYSHCQQSQLGHSNVLWCPMTGPSQGPVNQLSFLQTVEGLTPDATYDFSVDIGVVWESTVGTRCGLEYWFGSSGYAVGSIWLDDTTDSNGNFKMVPQTWSSSPGSAIAQVQLYLLCEDVGDVLDFYLMNPSLTLAS